MGLFSKKPTRGTVDPADFVALRSELVDMKARLDVSEQARAVVEARLSALDATAEAFGTERNGMSEVTNMVAQLRQQIADRPNSNGATTGAAEASALPPPPTTLSGPDPDTLERIAAVQQRVDDLDQIRHRLGEIDHLAQRMGEIDHLHQRVAGVETLHQRLDELDGVGQRLTTTDSLAAQLAEINERLRIGEVLQDQVGQLAERLSVNDAEARAAREHMATLDQRLTNVSTELANQISELGSDIDGLGQRIPGAADGIVSDEIVDALRGGQVKLANEQARFEIAFRHDLATLAEQLRHGRDDA